MTVLTNPQTLDNPTVVAWYPLEQPASSMRITISENEAGEVILEGLALPQEQMEGLSLLLQVWKYGLEPVEIQLLQD